MFILLIQYSSLTTRNMESVFQTFSRMVTDISETLCPGLLKWVLTASSMLSPVLSYVPLIGLYLYTIARHDTWRKIVFALNPSLFQQIFHCLNSYHCPTVKSSILMGLKSSLKDFPAQKIFPFIPVYDINYLKVEPFLIFELNIFKVERFLNRF